MRALVLSKISADLGEFPPRAARNRTVLPGGGGPCSAFLATLVLASLPSLGVCPADSSSLGLAGLTARLSA